MVSNSFDLEFEQDFSFLRLYSSTAYDFYKANSYKKIERNRLAHLSELDVSMLSRMIRFGCCYLYSVYDEKVDKTWQIQPFTILEYGNFRNVISFRYWDFHDYFDREINLISGYKILPYWNISFNASYFLPSYDEHYYQVGLQTKIDYEMD